MGARFAHDYQYRSGWISHRRFPQGHRPGRQRRVFQRRDRLQVLRMISARKKSFVAELTNGHLDGHQKVTTCLMGTSDLSFGTRGTLLEGAGSFMNDTIERGAV